MTFFPTIETGQLRFHARDVLQMYFYGIWRSICFARWDIYDSTVSCRQLGYRTSKEVDLYYYYFYDFTDYWIQNVVCFGNESKLSDCRFDLGHYCDYYNPVNLNCVSGKRVVCIQIALAHEIKELL